MGLRIWSVAALMGLASATIESETIVHEKLFTDRQCSQIIYGLSYSHHSDECVKQDNRYEMSVCTKDGYIEERMYNITDGGCDGEPYKVYTIEHDACIKTVQFGQKVYVKRTLTGHCQGARMCTKGWECAKEGWKVEENFKEGAHPKCMPDVDSEDLCTAIFFGMWKDDMCHPSPVIDDACPGEWVRSHEGSRLDRCMHPKAVCPGCGNKVTSAKIKCHNNCKSTKKKVAMNEDAACACDELCDGALAWMLVKPKKSGKKGKCTCYESTGEGASVKVSLFEMAKEDDTKFKYVSASENGLIN